jgi:ribonuclease VapC
MVVDTSAILAILRRESEAQEFLALLSQTQPCYISAVALLEAGIVTQGRKGKQGVQELDAFVQRSSFTIEPFTAEQAQIARDAYTTYGKGRHPARLNFGDCASYALAKLYGEPLLFKGTDFSQTDIEVAYQGGYKSV